MQRSKPPNEPRDTPQMEAARRASYIEAARRASNISTPKRAILSSAKESIITSLRDGTLAFSDWLLDTTPFFLVSVYFVVTTAIFCFSNEEAIRFFYYSFMCTTFYLAAGCVVESFLGLTPVRDARIAAMDVEASGLFPSDLNGKSKDLPVIDLVIVAYLPNEKDIIRSQVLYAAEELIYPKEKLRINLVYNTPSTIEPLETELSMLPDQCPNLRVIKVPGSRSKADNLNYFFSLRSNADIIGIFDSDHCPHPHNPRWAAERFLYDPTIDIIQGRCITYNTATNWFTRMIAIEFDKLYALSLPGRSRISNFGLSSGSNGYWKGPLLRTHKMHGEILTEDFDASLRAYSAGKKTIHDMNVCSFEMAPISFQSFWKQRLRWAQGWTQTSLKHLPLIWRSSQTGSKRPFSERYGLLSLLFIRELSPYLTTAHLTLLLSLLIIDRPTSFSTFIHCLFFRYPISEWFSFATLISLIYTLYLTDKIRSEFTSWKDMVVFSLVYIPYLVLVGIVGIYAQCRQLVGYSNWNVTARK